MEDAYATLLRASRLLGAMGPDRGDNDAVWASRSAAGAFVHNSLGELDRFLIVLIGALERELAAAGCDVGAIARCRGTANKLRALRAVMHRASPDHDRLQAIRRMRHHLRARTIARGGRNASDHAVRPPGDAMDEPAALSPGELQSICLFYADLADRLIAERRDHARGVAFGRDGPYMTLANVACDGT